MATVARPCATLEDALRTSHPHQGGGPPRGHAPVHLPRLKAQQRKVFRSVFQTEISQPTPHATPVAAFPDQGQPFGLLASGSSRRLRTEAGFSLSQDSEDLQLPDAGDVAAIKGQSSGGGLRSGANAVFPQQPLQARQGLAGQVEQRRGEAATEPTYAADDQLRFDRAWHVVTTRISLPSSVALEDSFGTLPPESQPLTPQDAASEAEFQDALRLVLDAHAILPQATHVEDILSWHTSQARRHFAHHVLPMLSACVGEAPSPGCRGDADTAMGVPAGSPVKDANIPESRYYEHHMDVVLNSVRTLEAAFRLYFYGLTLLVRGLQSAPSGHVDSEDGSPPRPKPDAVVSRFQQDVNALVANSTPPGLMVSIRVVFSRFASTILGFDPSGTSDESTGSNSNNNTPFKRRRAQGAPVSTAPRKTRPSTGPGAAPRPPTDADVRVEAMRQQMRQVLTSLHNVGLAGENFQVLFAEIMDEKMADFIQLSFAGRWKEHNTLLTADGPVTSYRHRISRGLLPPTTCIGVLHSWVENHFARLANEVLTLIGTSVSGAVPFSDVKKWKEEALGRLSALRMAELFDIVLQWPLSRGGLEDLRVSVTTPQRRSHLVSTFSSALRTRLLHPACSTLEILQIYIAMIRTFHVLDPSNVLLSAAVGPLQFYLCQRDDAVRIVVDGLLADTENELGSTSTVASRIAKARADSFAPVLSGSSTPTNGAKLVELAAMLNDPFQQRRRHVDEEELDWNDMEWVPDPIDAGTNYRRPKSEDVIGTLINTLGSREAFTKEFQNIIAERLLSPQEHFVKEVKVLNLLKKRFGEASMQNCEVMIRDIDDSRRLNITIDMQAEHTRNTENTENAENAENDNLVGNRPERPSPWQGQAAQSGPPLGARIIEPAIQYDAKILSRLYWPGLGREMFLLPRPVADKQAFYSELYEEQKEGRKLAWLNHLGQASVELELEDRTVSAECKTYEAAVIYAFQDPEAGEGDGEDEDAPMPTGPAKPPIQRTLPELVEMLQMDEDLVSLALAFWHKQGVLRQDPRNPESYSVVESLAAAAAADAEAEAEARAQAAARAEAEANPEMPSDVTEEGPAAAAAVAAVARNKREARADDAQRTVYWQFIVGMLTNSAASMPLAQIAMMMKMLMAEGFPWSNDELQEFLGEKVADGELEIVGGKYRLVKK